LKRKHSLAAGERKEKVFYTTNIWILERTVRVQLKKKRIWILRIIGYGY
jgi:hypothetical protein